VAKLTKQMYYKANGERKINCYKVAISKELIKQAKIHDNDEIKVYAGENKIIIEKVSK
jgi:antitoxin component of MazEF toxin-antitoxin module